jgi:hypothetical protein
MRPAFTGERARKFDVRNDFIGCEHHKTTAFRVAHPLCWRCEPLYAAGCRFERRDDRPDAAITRDQALLLETAQRLTHRVATHAVTTDQLELTGQHRSHRISTGQQIFLQHLRERSVTWLTSIDTHRLAS